MGKFDGLLLLSDIDGTIAKDGVISEENRTAVEYFKQNGGMFAYATGRLPNYIADLKPVSNVPVIAINGTLIYDEKQGVAIQEFPLKLDDLCVAREVAERYRPDIIDICTADKRIQFYNPSPFDFEEFDEKIFKILYVFDTEEATLSAKTGLSSRYRDYTFERSWNTGLEMRSCISGKGVCLKILKELTGARIAVAAGDFENDTEMLSAADIGFAPYDALPDVKMLADRVTVSFEENVIASIIEQIEKEMGDTL